MGDTKDNVNSPEHYTVGKIECIDVMHNSFGTEFVKHNCLCNAIKYFYRHRKKNGLEDIKKAHWYLSHYIEKTDEADKREIKELEKHIRDSLEIICDVESKEYIMNFLLMHPFYVLIHKNKDSLKSDKEILENVVESKIFLDYFFNLE